MSNQCDGFTPFPKIARWFRDVVVSEKLDGTNACVVVEKTSPVEKHGAWVEQADTWRDDPFTIVSFEYDNAFWRVMAQSRTRFIVPGADNFGFAAWVKANADKLIFLGPGRHYGEWWGHGIQRGYGLPPGDRRFSLFNASRWTLNPSDPRYGDKHLPVVPGIGVVPVLYRGLLYMPNGADPVREALRKLQFAGSQAAPFMNPEGVVVFHVAGGVMFKATLDNDQAKGQG